MFPSPHPPFFQLFAHLLPLEVVAPGAPVAPVTAKAAERSGLPRSCIVCGGTTDSIAAFLAAGVTQPGEVRPLMPECSRCRCRSLPSTSLPSVVACCSPLMFGGHHVRGRVLPLA